jgi:hypothetical protein
MYFYIFMEHNTANRLKTSIPKSVIDFKLFNDLGTLKR